MTRRPIASGTAALALLMLVASLGCTHDEAVTSGNARAFVEASVVSQPPSRWDTALLELDRLFVVPIDPEAAANLGASPSQIDLIPGEVGFDLRTSTKQLFFETPIPPGKYQIVSLYWVPPTLVDPDADPDAETCIEKIDQIPPPPTTLVKVVAQEILVVPPIEFSVPSGGAVSVAVEVNAAGLVTDYETRWFCVDDPNARCNQELAPCLSGWDSAGFQQAIPQYITVRVE